MLVDWMLKIIGESPAGYYEQQDKWIAIVAFLIDNDHFFMPWIIGALPIIWLLVRKKRHKPTSSIRIIIALILAIVLAALGFVILDWLSDLAFGLSYQRMYGDLFE